jgi:hypothetical protein
LATTGLTTAVHNDILDHLLLTTAWMAPAAIYVALYAGDPVGAGSELSGDGYARVQHEAWNAATGGQATNDGDITFPAATDDWTQADHVAVFDAETTGNMLAAGPLETAKTVQNGDTAKFADTELVVAIARKTV